MKISGLETLDRRRTNLCVEFAKKAVKNEKMKHLFQPNNKNHIMKTRNAETYFVTHAKTERLRRSSIPYMQTLLNNETKT